MPAAGINSSDTSAFDGLLKRIRSDGKTPLLIEHYLAFATGFCDQVAGLDFGTKISGVSAEAG